MKDTLILTVLVNMTWHDSSAEFIIFTMSSISTVYSKFVTKLGTKSITARDAYSSKVTHLIVDCFFVKAPLVSNYHRSVQIAGASCDSSELAYCSMIIEFFWNISLVTNPA